MVPADFVFLILATLIVACGFVVVFHSKIIYSAFALLFSFFGVGGIYILLNADFLAGTQLIVYVGGISVLILFGILLTKKIYNLTTEETSTQKIIGGATSLAFLGALAALIFNTDWQIVTTTQEFTPQTLEIGKAFMGNFILPFELAAILLLVALIGAVIIGRDEKKEEI
ncbi:NADH-quinone oxidoreductase subunit J [bacterium]|nr:NADH-quinone oxidoreductase subunit J [bacterium]